jgi:hypothetical protein
LRIDASRKFNFTVSAEMARSSTSGGLNFPARFIVDDKVECFHDPSRTIRGGLIWGSQGPHGHPR